MASHYSKLHESTLKDPLLKRHSEKIIYSYYLTKSLKFGYAWPSLDTIVNETQTSKPTVKRCIRHLKSIGYLKIKTKGGIKGRLYDTNQYFVKKPAAQLAPSKPKLSLEEQLKKDKAIFLSLAGRLGVRVDDVQALLAPVNLTVAKRKLDDQQPHTLSWYRAKKELDVLTTKHLKAA